LVVPAYNEEGGVGRVVTRARKALRAARIPHEILVVDDGSTDRTAAKAAAAGARVVSLGRNLGYGAALKAGYRESRGSVLAMADADGTYPPEELPGLVRALAGADMVVGARTAPGAAVPWLRRPVKRLLTLWAEYLSDRSIPDLNSGLRVFRREPYERFQGLLSQRFSFTTTLTLSLECHGYRVLYLPIPYHPRVGSSKIRPFSDTLQFFSLVLRTVMYFRPLKIFIPLSGIMAFTGIALGLWKVTHEGGISDATTLLLAAALQTAMLGLLADLVVKRNR
jgi:glycosyltransferase involved in cell wall biosynthesis